MMKLIRGLHNLSSLPQGCVATIGNFDGVHIGHQHVLAQLKQKGDELGLPTVVMTFDPQPQEFFKRGTVPARLTRLREKLLIMKRLGCVDKVLCIIFNDQLAAMPAQTFVEQVLVEKPKIQFLVVGDDFRFGHDRLGDFRLLQEMGAEYGFEVIRMPSVQYEGRRVSSSWVRRVLTEGNLQLAEHLLGRPYSMCGRVAHGDKLGRTLGFPTANIYLHRNVSPVLGIFVVKMYGIREQAILGVANVGNRPTVGGTRTLLEVFLFDFNEDIYGRHVRVDFLHKLRDEEYFESIELLKQQMVIDAENARAFFASSKG